MPERYFLDANVLFTAAISPDGVSVAILKLALIDACEALTSAFAIDEARRNLRAKRPRSLGTLDALAVRVDVVPEADQALVMWAARHLPSKDAPILAAAVAARADVLVTGDRRHFGNLYGKTLKEVTILPPREALERLLG